MKVDIFSNVVKLNFYIRNYHPSPKSIDLYAASLSSSVSDKGSYHLASNAIPIWPP